MIKVEDFKVLASLSLPNFLWSLEVMNIYKLCADSHWSFVVFWGCNGLVFCFKGAPKDECRFTFWKDCLDWLPSKCSVSCVFVIMQERRKIYWSNNNLALTLQPEQNLASDHTGLTASWYQKRNAWVREIFFNWRHLILPFWFIYSQLLTVIVLYLYQTTGFPPFCSGKIKTRPALWPQFFWCMTVQTNPK